MISVIIPTLNAAESLDACLYSLGAINPDKMEVFVVDGGSIDGTLEIANEKIGVTCLSAPKGRASQMNAGAAEAWGDIFLFLHADTELEADWMTAIQSTLDQPKVSLGAFRFALKSKAWQARLIEWGVRLRCSLLKLPYGDQALFVRAKDFSDWGEYPKIPLFEDVELVSKAKRHGEITILTQCAKTSACRWQREGWFKRSLKNRSLLKAYTKNPGQVTELETQYSQSEPALCIFCKYPDPGKVKTRLAKGIGEEKATKVYRDLVDHTLTTIRNCTLTPYIYFSSAEDASRVRTWLGNTWRILPQCEGDLGARMLGASSACFKEGHSKTLLIGTDCPQITTQVIHDALRALDNVDLVLGPTYDGGYYLFGSNKLHSELFKNIPWSTEQVWDETLKKVKASGLTFHTLPRLHDVDTADDLVHC